MLQPATAEPGRPLLAKERAMWLLHEYASDGSVLNVAFAIEPADGQLDLGVLREAVAVVVARHPALRTTFPAVDGEPVRLTQPAAGVVTTGILRVADVAAGELAGALRRATAIRFDLGTELPVRVSVLRSAGRQVVCVTVSHLVYDAFSARIVQRDLQLAYEALRAGHGVPAELRQEAVGPALRDGSAESLRYWADKLTGAVPSADLTVGRQAGRIPGFPGAISRLRMRPDAWAAAESIARETSCPVSAVALAAFAAVLYRHGAGGDLVLGVPTYNRGRPAHEAVGYYMCIQPVRVRFTAETAFTELVRRCARLLLEGLEYADTSLDEVSVAAYEGDESGRRPLVRYLFNYLADFTAGQSAGTGWRDVMLPAAHSRLDADLAFGRDEDGIVLRAIYAADLFSEEQIAALLERMQEMLAAAGRADAPVGSLGLATQADQELLAAAWPAAETAAAERDVLEDVAASAFADGQAVAIGPGWRPVAAASGLDYASLAAAADALGAALRGAGVPAGSLAAAGTRTLADTCVAVLGCWSAGCAMYLGTPPPGGPDVALRIRPAGEPAGPGEIAVEYPGGSGAMVLFDRPHPDDVALRWAGPDGPVALTHRAVAEAVAAVAAELALGPADVVAIARRPQTGASLVDALAALRSGAQAAEAAAASAAALAAAAEAATVLVASPLVAARLLDAPPGAARVTRIAVRGGRLPGGLAERAAAAGISLVRVLGPVGPDGLTVAAAIGPDAAPGYLAGPGQGRVVDPAGQPVLPFVRGRLAVASWCAPASMPVQLTRHGLELLDDSAPALALSALLADGQIRYAGLRRDATPPVLIAEVRIAAQGGRLAQRKSGAAVQVHDGLLPVDEDGEPDLVAQSPGAGDGHPEAGPGTAETEIAGVDVIGLWCEALGRSDISPHDNFVKLGGDSLKAARVLGQLKKRTGYRVSMRTVFKFPTPATFAAAVRTGARAPGRR